MSNTNTVPSAEAKAKELIGKMAFHVNDVLFENAKETAIGCALICVDECIKIAPIDKFENINSPDGLSPEEIGLYLFVEHWQQVKQEIEKL